MPGGDLITLSHWRRAIQVAGYISKANDIYAYVSPILNPLSGLARLGTRELIIKPAWKDMQQNVLRWFYQAYVNRVGVHLIELMSGRLAIGAQQYRRLTRRSSLTAVLGQAEGEPLVADIVGARGSGKSRLVESMQQVLSGDPGLIKARFEGRGLDPTLIGRLRNVQWVEIPGYAPNVEKESRRDRSARQEAVAAAVDCDMLILVIDGEKSLQTGGRRLRPGLGPLLHRASAPRGAADPGRHHRDRPAQARGRSGRPHTTGRPGKGRARSPSARSSNPFAPRCRPASRITPPPGCPARPPSAWPSSCSRSSPRSFTGPNAQALLRQLHAFSGRSKVGRVMTQLGQHGRQVWTNLKARRKGTQAEALIEGRSADPRPPSFPGVSVCPHDPTTRPAPPRISTGNARRGTRFA